MVKKFQSIAVLIVFVSNLLLAARNGLNWLNGLAIVFSALAILLGFVGGRGHE